MHVPLTLRIICRWAARAHEASGRPVNSETKGVGWAENARIFELRDGFHLRAALDGNRRVAVGARDDPAMAVDVKGMKSTVAHAHHTEAHLGTCSSHHRRRVAEEHAAIDRHPWRPRH